MVSFETGRAQTGKAWRKVKAGWSVLAKEAGAGYRSGTTDGNPPIPDPFSDADALDELAEEITTLAAHIHAATHRLLALIAEFDRRRGWELGGHRSCAHWLHFRTGIDLGAAREKVRAARALQTLPLTGAAMARGELSFSKVRALTRVANPGNEGDLLELARGCTTAQLERTIRAFRKFSAEDEAALERERFRSRRLSIFPDDDGMYLIRGRLTAEVGALLMRAIDAASDSLYREEKAAGNPGKGGSAERGGGEQASKSGEGRDDGISDGGDGGGNEVSAEVSLTEAARRRADALGLLAERALSAGFEGSPISGARAARYQVVLHVEPGTLKSEGPVSRFRRELLARNTKVEEGIPGRSGLHPRSHLEDGTRVSPETSRRISCDCGVVRVHSDINGSILNVGRKTRSIPPTLRRALEARDRGCRFPGCGHRFTDAHHVRHWADGGETSLDNTLLLCSYHHRLLHEGGWTVEWWGRGRPVFMDPRGQVHFEGRWQPPPADGDQGDRKNAGSSGVAWKNAGSNDAVSNGGGRNDAVSTDVGGKNAGSSFDGRKDKGRTGADALLRENRAMGIDPHPYTASARWKREVDIPGEILWPAEEAML